MCPEERIPTNPGRKKKPKRKKSLKIPRPKKTEIHDGGIRLPQEGSKREFYQNIGMRIRAYRKKSGMRQGELAGLVGISTSAVSNLEKGKSMVTVYTLGRIAEALGIGMGEMFQGSPGTGIEGKTYFFSVQSGDGLPAGALFRNGSTPDGHTVDANGVLIR